MKIADNLWKVISICFIVFLIPFLLYNGGIFEVLSNGGEKGKFFPLLWMYLFICFIYFLIGKNFVAKLKRDLEVAMSIFILTALPRLLLMLKQIYIPTSDFNSYFNYGINVYYGNFDAVADVIGVYRMPGMGGLALWNGLIAKLFSPTLIGFQIANTIIVSCIAILLFYLLKSYDRNVAIIASFIFALYPSNIISTQIIANPHSAILFFLLAILFYQKALNNKKKEMCICYTILSGFLLAWSNFFHQSVIVIILSMMCFCLLYILGKNIKEKKYKTFIVTLVTIVAFQIISSISVAVFCNVGIIHDTREDPFIAKLIVGLNEETKGTYCLEDYRMISSWDETEQEEKCREIILERIVNSENLLGLFCNKTYKAWFTEDSYIANWFINGRVNEYNLAVTEGTITDLAKNDYLELRSWVTGAAYLDTVVVHLIYWFAIIGLWRNRKEFQINSYGILTFISLGWICVIMLSEMQTRYRYPAMLSFIALSAIGIYELYKLYKRRRIK